MENNVKLKKGVFGYGKKQVAEYIDELSKSFNAVLDEKDTKIDALQNEVNTLSNSLKLLEAEKDSIANGIISAQNEAKKIIDEANKNANMVRLQADVELENTLQKIANAKEELVALKAKTMNFINEYKDLIDGFVKSEKNDEN